MNIFNQPGFLGTHAPFLSDITLIAILLTAVLFTIGWQLARRRKYEAHRWIQSISVVINSAVVILVMVKSFVVHILPGIPAKLTQGDYAVTTTHAIIGTLSVLVGIFVALRGNNAVPAPFRFNNYKLFMRTAYGLYMLATLLGVIVYVEVYILGI
jgi:uncharacterized membrane protein YozB (DUF420 family)